MRSFILPFIAAAAIAATTVARADGALDTTFGIQGRYLINDLDGVGPLLLQADGRPVAWSAKQVTADCIAIAARRLSVDASSVDTTFGSAGVASACFKDLYPAGALVSSARALAATAVPGGMLLAGISYSNNLVTHASLAKFTDQGALDSSFGTGGRVCLGCNPEVSYAETITGVAQRTGDGTLIAGGYLTPAASSSRHGKLWALSPTGTLLNTFDDTAYSDAIYNAIAVQPDGKVLVTGFAHNAVTNNNDCLVERLILQGNLFALDSSFNGTGRLLIPFELGGSNNDYCNAIALQPDGLILVAGEGYNGADFDTSDFIVARVNGSGTLDTNFSNDGKLNTYFELRAAQHHNIASQLALQSDGKILVAGYGSVDAAGRAPTDMGVVRFLPNGVADGSFVGTTPGSNFATVMVSFELLSGAGSTGDNLRALVLQAGRPVLYGYSAANGSSYPVLARLQSDFIFINGFN